MLSPNDPLVPTAKLHLFDQAHLRSRCRVRFASAQWPPPERSGDFFEFFLDDHDDDSDGSGTFFFGDVSGNGMDAAGFAVQVRALLDEHVRQLSPHTQPRIILATLNEVLEKETVSGRFVAAVAARIDARHRAIHIASAGHLGPFVRRRWGRVVRVCWPSGPPIGIVHGQHYDETHFDLGIEDAVVFASDGVTDRFATAADPVGETGLMERLARLNAEPAELSRKLLRAGSPPPHSRRQSDAMVLTVMLTA